MSDLPADWLSNPESTGHTGSAPKSTAYVVRLNESKAVRSIHRGNKVNLVN